MTGGTCSMTGGARRMTCGTRSMVGARALQRASQHLNVARHLWRLSHELNPSINCAILGEPLRRYVADPALLGVLERILDASPSGRGVGIPIGNLTSQIFSQPVSERHRPLADR